MKILLADDERETIDFLKNALLKKGWEIVLAYDGEEAKNKITEELPDVIILDITMPRLSGWQVLEWLRIDAKLNTPVIMISAKNEMADIKKSYELSADYYIIKPVQVKDLIKGINTVSLIKKQIDDLKN